jgi:acetone carboxylase gamma subunit
MVHAVDEQLRQESRRFRLAFTCPDCAHLDPDNERCSLGFPIAPHHSPDLDQQPEVTFCKAFELF